MRCRSWQSCGTPGGCCSSAWWPGPWLDLLQVDSDGSRDRRQAGTECNWGAVPGSSRALPTATLFSSLEIDPEQERFSIPLCLRTEKISITRLRLQLSAPRPTFVSLLWRSQTWRVPRLCQLGILQRQLVGRSAMISWSMVISWVGPCPLRQRWPSPWSSSVFCQHSARGCSWIWVCSW